jgi:signal transduction histidine kinase
MAPRRFQQLSIRNKLLVLVLLPLVVVLPLLGLILAWAGTAFDQLLITKVRSDLAVAQGYFERVIGDLGANAGSVADSHELHLALARNDPAELAEMLRKLRLRYGFDFINLRAPDGSIRLTPFGTPGQVFGAAAADAEAPRGLRRGGAAGASLELLTSEALGLFAPDLTSRVAVPLVPTRNAALTTRLHEERAMVALAAAPVHAAGGGALLGYVQAGVLLNRNLSFIDHINEIVYPKGSLPFGSQGTATLFLDDVRITTNVHLFGGDPQADRAIGTRVSQTVRDAVLGRGDTWLDRAFVVDEWYVSAYRPLEDGAQHRIGMLYVGYLERPFTWLKYGMLASIGVVFFVVMVAAALVSLRWARGVFRPLEQMAQTMRRVEAGSLDARVGPMASGDEIGQLAGHLDRLLDAVDRQTTALQRWNAELDAKVVERTQALEAAQAQLLRAERLAAMGQLTAGIAHEVNNPIGVIQGNLDVVRELLGADAQRVRSELRLVDEQIERMRLMVTQMLQFARPGEYAGDVQAVDAAQALDNSLVLVEHLRTKQHVEVHRRYTATRRPAVNRHELQQVLVNLLTNALNAMPEGGRLEVSTRDEGDDDVAIDVADTGPGIGAEPPTELFKPFVTRRKDGTGLGLWISRSIAERYGGDIVAAGRTDGERGAMFTVRLKAAT